MLSCSRWFPSLLCHPAALHCCLSNVVLLQVVPFFVMLSCCSPLSNAVLLQVVLCCVILLISIVCLMLSCSRWFPSLLCHPAALHCCLSNVVLLQVVLCYVILLLSID